MVILGVLPAAAAIASIDVDTILLLLGMMIVVAGLEAAGLFHRLAAFVVRHSATPRRLLLGVAAATAVASALVLNDAVVLVFTPVLLHACRRLRVDPVPYLVTEACSANIGSLATPIGNPQVAYIALKAGLTFTEFTLAMAPLAALAFLLALPILLWGFRKSLARPFESTPTPDPLPLVPRHALPTSLAIVALLTAGFFLHDRFGQTLSLLALAGGAAFLIAAPLAGLGTARTLLARVDWGVIVLFLGLFIVLGGVQASGAYDTLVGRMERAAPGLLDDPIGLGALAAVLSNLLSNVPATLLLAPLADSRADWFALAASTTLSGNATLMGAAANLIVAERAHAEGVEISFWGFARVGLIVSVMTTTVALAVISVVS